MTKTPDLRENLVVKSNELIEASYSLTINEQRLLLACISQIDSREPLDSKKEFEITIERAQDLFYSEATRDNVYRDLETACKRLFERKVTIKLSDDKFLDTRFVQSVEYDIKNRLVKIQFADKILPYISELKKNFTKYRLKNIVELTSVYAVRLYELIVSWNLQNQITYKEIELDDFRKMLLLGGKYRQFKDLNLRVITPAVEQINQSTDFILEIGFRKVGRTYRFIEFKFERKKSEIEAEAERKVKKIENEKSKQIRLEKQKKLNEDILAEKDKIENTKKLNEWDKFPQGQKFIHKKSQDVFIKNGEFVLTPDGKTINYIKVLAFLKAGTISIFEFEG